MSRWKRESEEELEENEFFIGITRPASPVRRSGGTGGLRQSTSTISLQAKLSPDDMFEMEQLHLDSPNTGGRMQSRKSVIDKAELDAALNDYNTSWNKSGCVGVLLTTLLVAFTVFRQYSGEDKPEFVVVPPTPHNLPSLNLFDYYSKLSFPVFEDYPFGVPRIRMPQFNTPVPLTLPGEWDTGSYWHLFHGNITLHDGFLSREFVDLKHTQPLQAELSGYIVYNRLLGEDGVIMKDTLDKNAEIFSEHIVLIRNPTDIVARNGTVIAAGTLLILDGHHTNEVLKICDSMRIQTALRGSESISGCGSNFKTEHDVVIVNNVAPLSAIQIAIETGSSTGHDIHVRL